MYDSTITMIDATDRSPNELNSELREGVASGERAFELDNVNGQRFIGAGITEEDVSIIVNGTPGNDLGMFSENLSVTVHGNAQDGVGNTMSSGTIIVDGHAGDVAGYGMRGGTILIKGDAGYRCGISMKEFESHVPTIVIGGKVRDFLGEYMAGGTILVLGLEERSRFEGDLVGTYVGTGMHAGTIYIRGEVDESHIHPHLEVTTLTPADCANLRSLLKLYATYFPHESPDKSVDLLKSTFTKIKPQSSRPYGSLYTPM